MRRLLSPTVPKVIALIAVVALVAGGVGYVAATAAISLGMTLTAGPLVIAVVVGLGALRLI